MESRMKTCVAMTIAALMLAACNRAAETQRGNATPPSASGTYRNQMAPALSETITLSNDGTETEIARNGAIENPVKGTWRDGSDSCPSGAHCITIVVSQLEYRYEITAAGIVSTNGTLFRRVTR